MRFLLVGLGSAGDVHPFIPVGRRLAERGHEVRLFANEVFRGAVEGAGLDFRPLGDEALYRAAAADPDLWHPRHGPRKVLEQAAEHLGELVDLLRENVLPGETVMAASSLAFGARLVQEADGVPLATVHLAPSLLVSVYRMPRIEGVPLPAWAPVFYKRALWWAADRVFDRLVRPHLEPVRRRLGLRPVRGIFRWWNSPERVIGLFPEWFARPQADWPRQLELPGFVLWDGGEGVRRDRELDAWLAAGERPVLYTAGSAHRHAGGFFAAAVDAAEAYGRRALLVTSEAENVPAELPEGVLHRSYVPFGRVLPRVAAFVHHGGIGTTAQALAAGVPQLVVSWAHDQLDNGSRVEDLGVGRVLPIRRFGSARAAGLVEELAASPKVAARCGEVAGWMREGDAVGETCELLEELVEVDAAGF